MRSLQRRLGLGLFASLALVFFLQWLAMSQAIRYFTEGYLLERMAHDATALLAALHPAQDAWRLDETRIDAVYKRPFDGHYYVIGSGAGALRSRSLWDADLDVPPVPPGQSRHWRSQGPMGQELLVLARGYRKEGRDVVVTVAEEITRMQADIRRFQWIYALLSLAMLMGLTWLQRRTVRKALATLDTTRQRIRQLEQGRIRQLDDPVPEEIRPLVGEINRLLRVMNHRLERSRNALGNLAHSIKQPLLMLAQLASDPALERHPAVIEKMERATGRLRASVERELKRARLAGAAAPGQHFRVEQDLPSLIDALHQLYREKDLHIDYEFTGAADFAADREDMLELFGNLLDNACRYAGSRVMLTLHGQGGLQFRVEDDGPGLPDEALRQLAAHGTRIDEHQGGHGLGLSIVRDIVLDYGGVIEWGRSQRLGGFLVSVTLPAAP